MIEVSHLSKNYGSKTALSDVSFSVKTGETVGLLGPNGAGKSTMMNIITGNLSASSGSVKIQGADILEEPLEAKKHLGYLPEIPPLYPDMTVIEYLRFVYSLKKCSLPREKHLKEVIEAAHISDVSDRLIKNLSKGYRQRIGVAQALISDPELLILDEPTVGLDPKQIQEMRELINGQARSRTVIISSHILSEIQATCSRILVLNGGKLIADDTPEGLSRRFSGGDLLVRAIGPAESVRAVLKKAEGVSEIKTAPSKRDGQCAFTVRCEDAEKARVGIAEVFKRSDFLLVELASTGMELEKIFLTLTGQEGGAE